jgi:hypothetical protein
MRASGWPAGGGESLPDWLRELNDLQAQGQQLAEQFGDAEAIDATYVGRDPASSVTATIGAGGRVRDLAFRPDWRRKVAEGELGAGVLAAADTSDGSFTDGDDSNWRFQA